MPVVFSDIGTLIVQVPLIVDVESGVDDMLDRVGFPYTDTVPYFE